MRRAYRFRRVRGRRGGAGGITHRALPDLELPFETADVASFRPHVLFGPVLRPDRDVRDGSDVHSHQA